MSTTIKVLNRNPLAKLTIPSIVSESSANYTSRFQLPEADAYARRLADEAELWLSLARERSRMREDTLVSKALHSLAFSLRHGAHDLAIPSKLSGTAKHQRTLWSLVRDRAALGTQLDTHEDGKRLIVSLGGDVLGEVQSKHTGWLRPLIPFGCRIYLVRITGAESEGYRLGANVAFGRAGSAVAALRHALGDGVGGDGYGEERGTQVALSASLGSNANAALVPVHPEADGLGGDPEDVVLWRDGEGIARASVRHIIRHSPTGLEWGYRGSGPADLAQSILLAFTDEINVEALYVAFKDAVIASVPEVGGMLRADDIRRWIDAHAAPGGDGAA